MELLQQIEEIGIVPVVKITEVEKAKPLAEALHRGGLPAAEVTFRTDCAEEAIRRMSEVPDMLIGAGTVLTKETADCAIAAGAKFIVSPGLNPEVVKHCIEKGIPVLPGTATPSEMEAAMALGLKTVKFFPAEQNGGVNYLKAISSPYQMLRFMPTGGVSTENMDQYLSLSNVIAVGGTWMVKEELIAAGNFAAIEAIAKEAVKKMLGLCIVHVGINCAEEKEAQNTAEKLSRLFGFPMAENPGSIFVGKGFEVIKKQYLGKNGHIAIGTKSVERAIAYFKRKGVSFREDTRNMNAAGKTATIYFSEEIGGFAFHLVQI